MMMYNDTTKKTNIYIKLVLICGLLAPVLFFGMSCSAIKETIAEYTEPQLEITVKEARLVSFGLTGVELAAEVRIANPGKMTVEVSKIGYGIYYQGEEMTSGVDETEWTLRPGEEATKDIPVFISINEFGPFLLVVPNNAPANVKGMAACATFFGGYDVPFDAETYLITE
ncbi:MAG: LEA type 2 family protein [bacterium]|nr:LEA type 2 family protein [bacterium]